jgi:hypothetical protein
MSDPTSGAERPDLYPYEHYEPYNGQAALRNQIVRTRADLGDTITELAARTDVKARAKEAVSQARTRTKAALQARARLARTRTSGAARSSAESARHFMGRASRNPVSIVAGAGAGALAGLGIYALLRRRMPLGQLRSGGRQRQLLSERRQRQLLSTWRQLQGRKRRSGRRSGRRG